MDQEAIKKGIYFSRTFKNIERNESDIVAADPLTGESQEEGALDLTRTSAAC